MTEDGKKIGVVFSGSAMRIGYHAGVIAEALGSGVRPDYMVGISGGAHIAEAASRGGAEGALDMVSRIRKRSDIWSLNLLRARGVFSPAPMKKMLAKFRKDYPTTEIYTEVGLCNVDDEALYFLSTNNVLRSQFGAVRPMFFSELSYAASAMPVVVEAQADPETGKRIWYDGGAMVNPPLRRAIELGADIIYCVLAYQYPPRPAANGESKYLPIVQDGLRALDMCLSASGYKDVRDCLEKNELAGYKKIDIRLVVPSAPIPIGDFEFDQGKIQKCIEVGREAFRSCVQLHTKSDFNAFLATQQ